MYPLFLIVQLVLIVAELVLIGFAAANKKKTKPIIIVVIVLQVLISGWLLIDRIEHKNHKQTCSCTEAYQCDNNVIDKNGYIKCNCIDPEEKIQEIYCPAAR